MNGVITKEGLLSLGAVTLKYDELTINLAARRAFLLFEGAKVYEWVLPEGLCMEDTLTFDALKGELPVKIA